MKTSKKLLLGFIGLIVLLMLVSDTVIWANYKNGRAGDGLLTDDENNKGTAMPVDTFKVLKIEGVTGRKLDIMSGEKYQITFWENKDQQFLYTTRNDTMFIKLRRNDHFLLECPNLETVILSGGGVSLQRFKQPSLNIQAGNSSKIELIDLQLAKLNVNGGEETDFFAFGDNSKIDSLQLHLGKGSTLKSFNVPYGQVSMDVDGLKDLKMNGRSLSSMKQIR